MLPAQPTRPSTTTGNRIVLGRLTDGDTVTFLRSGSGGWGIEISATGAPRYIQQKPAPRP